MHAILAILILAQAVSSPHRDTPKQAWEYTDEERFAMRFDPVSMRERAEHSARQRGRTSELDAIADGNVPNVVEGLRNPELFLPFELFTLLIRDAYFAEPEWQQMTRKRLQPFGAGDDFWSAMESSAEPMINTRIEERELSKKLSSATSDEERRRISGEYDAATGQAHCAIRYEALRRATEVIGRERLYRVLYEGIAPGLSTTSRDPDLYSRFQFLNGGCR